VCERVDEMLCVWRVVLCYVYTEGESVEGCCDVMSYDVCVCVVMWLGVLWCGVESCKSMNKG
jgi:hypothetical protein